jgi:hypothetical protein
VLVSFGDDEINTRVNQLLAKEVDPARIVGVMERAAGFVDSDCLGGAETAGT